MRCFGAILGSRRKGTGGAKSLNIRPYSRLFILFRELTATTSTRNGNS